MTLLWILVGLIANMVIGAGVWAYLDDKEGSMLKWFDSCPEVIAWWAQPLTLTLWPLALYWCWRDTHEDS